MCGGVPGERGKGHTLRGRGGERGSFINCQEIHAKVITITESEEAKNLSRVHPPKKFEMKTKTEETPRPEGRGEERENPATCRQGRVVPLTSPTYVHTGAKDAHCQVTGCQTVACPTK